MQERYLIAITNRIRAVVIRATMSAMMVQAVLLLNLVGPFPSYGATLEHEISTQSHDHHVETHWSYFGADDPDHWALLQPAFRGCETGTQQSPINIQTVRHGHHSDQLSFDYHPAPAQIVHTGHTIQVTYPSGSTLIYNGRSYQLRQFHFHHPSEHQFHAFSYPMEIHLVHQDATGHILVLGIFVEYGERNAAFGEWLERIPQHAGEKTRHGMINAKELLPKTHHHFTYHGSLTTPPCTEGVQWVILRTPVPLSPDQVQTFTQTIGNNARPTQALYGRQINEE